MLSVSAAVLAALDAQSRQIKLKAIIHFSSPLTITGADYLIGMDSLEEEYLDSSNIFGLLSANECSLKLLNTDRVFSVTNTSSPYYGQLKPGVKVEVILQVYTTTFVDVPLGTFYAVEWPTGTTGTFVEVLCRDRLFIENNKTVSAITVQQYITVKEAIEALFVNAGTTGYSVDSSLTYTMPYWFHGDSTLGEQLQKFVSGYGCRVYVNKVDGIVVKKARTSSSVATLTGANQILTLKGSADSRYLFSEVAVTYTNYTEVEASYERVLAPGTNTIATLKATKKVNKMFSNVIITSVDCSSYKIDLVSPGYGDTKVTVTAIDTAEEVLVTTDSGLVSSFGSVVKKLDSTIIQDAAEATLIAQEALDSVVIEKVIILQVRGNVALELGDKVTVTNNATATTGTYHITKIKYEFNGSLSGTYTLLRS